MGPRTGVDAVGGGHERFFEVPKFFFDRPFWIARFGAPVLDRPFLDRPFWIGRPFWTACLGQPIYWSNSAPAARYGSSAPQLLMAPHGTRNMGWY